MSEENKPPIAPEISATPAASPEAPAEKKADAPKEAAKKEKPTNCGACNKALRKRRWYYRNGKYYCTKRCWQTTVKKEEKPAEATPAQETK